MAKKDLLLIGLTRVNNDNGTMEAHVATVKPASIIEQLVAAARGQKAGPKIKSISEPISNDEAKKFFS